MTCRRAPADIYPCPEAFVDGAGWTIREVRGVEAASFCSETRTLVVPLDESAASRLVRVHELAHARWTGAELPTERASRLGVSLDTLNAVEDWRVNRGIVLRLEDPEAVVTGGLSRGELSRLVQFLLESEDLRNLCLVLVAARPFTALRTRFERRMKRCHEGRELLAKARSIVSRVLPPWTSQFHPPTSAEADRVAQDLESLLPAAASRSSTEEEWSPPLFAGGVTGRVAAALAETTDDSPDGLPFTPGIRRMLAVAGESGNPRWGHMTLTRPPLVRNLSGGRLRRRSRPGVEGRELRYAWRLCSDQRVFARPGRRAPGGTILGGTILVDASGSMKLASDAVDSILLACPGATVAVYAGEKLGKQGWLWIVAARGRAVAADFSAWDDYRSNVIDGPALSWLASQRRPRLWVSDGGVTGVGDRPAKVLEREAMGIVRQAGIERAETVVDALEKIRRTQH